MGIGELRTMDNRHGDVKIMWDSDKSEEVASAREQFDRLRGKGYLAYKTDKKGEKGEVIREFDPDAERIIMAPQMRGGV